MLCFALSDPLFVTVVYTCTSGEQALCGCACYKTLDPYITLPQRLELIIIKHIVPLCNAMKAGQILYCTSKLILPLRLPPCATLPAPPFLSTCSKRRPCSLFHNQLTF